MVWSEQIGRKVPDSSEIENALFHYTTNDGVSGILNNNSLFASLCGISNDSSEIEYAISVIYNIFRPHAEEYIYSHEKIGDLISDGADITSLPHSYLKLIVWSMLKTKRIFTISFCKHNNNQNYLHGLLSQWRGYGADGGYAIQINYNRLCEATNNLNSDELYCKLKKCQYGPNGTFTDNLNSNIEELVDKFKLYFESYLGHHVGEQNRIQPLQGFSEELFNSVVESLAFTKSPHFEEENEWRIVILNNSNNEVGIRASRSGLTTYIKFPAEGVMIDYIDRILVGPHPSQQQRCDAVSVYLDARGLKRICVDKSLIPLNS